MPKPQTLPEKDGFRTKTQSWDYGRDNRLNAFGDWITFTQTLTQDLQTFTVSRTFWLVDSRGKSKLLTDAEAVDVMANILWQLS